MNPTTDSVQDCDYLLVGSGIAAASLAYFLAPAGRTVLLEREDQPGYHSTGRSAALYIASYGTPQVRALTLASRAFFDQPPQGFADGAILTPRGVMMVAGPGQQDQLDESWQVIRQVSPQGLLLDQAQALQRVPVLRPEQVLGAVLEPDASDIDVHRLHQAYLRGARHRGAQLVNRAEVTALARDSQGRWVALAAGRQFRAPILVNAAGAWCDQLAGLAGVAPLGLVPKRRSAFVFPGPTGIDFHGWPACVGTDESWYFKPDAGQLLGSPANADPTVPQDVQPEELDIALGIDRIETVTRLSVRPSRSWAGLRSFVADGDLVGGFDDAAPGFFWLAAQGGYGIQTSAAMGLACAALVRGLPLPQQLADFGLTADMLGPARLRRSV